MAPSSQVVAWAALVTHKMDVLRSLGNSFVLIWAAGSWQGDYIHWYEGGRSAWELVLFCSVVLCRTKFKCLHQPAVNAKRSQRYRAHKAFIANYRGWMCALVSRSAFSIYNPTPANLWEMLMPPFSVLTFSFEAFHLPKAINLCTIQKPLTPEGRRE